MEKIMDPDPGGQIYVDPDESGSATLIGRFITNSYITKGKNPCI